MKSQGENPSGYTGLIIGRLMNFFHSGITGRALSKINIQDNFVCLDIGCGGGYAVKFMADQLVSGKMYGMDHSNQMVKLSKKNQ